MTKSECPEALKNCHPFFIKLVNPAVRDTLTTDINTLTSLFDDIDELDDDTIIWDDKATRAIPPEVHEAISSFIGPEVVVPRVAQFLPHFKRDSLTYAASYKHAGNSRVMLKSTGNVLPVPARIEYIVQLRLSMSARTLVAFRPYRQSSILPDAFSCFPVLQASILSDELGPIEITEPAQIACHFAYLPTEIGDEKILIAVPLSRVSNHNQNLCCPDNLYYLGLERDIVVV